MENPSFYLEGVVRDKEEMQDFEGPLSLILQLLSKNKIEIRDIRISEILDQYLAYLEQMQQMDLEIASEFVQMAAHLLYIKTRTLLAGEEEVSELELLKSSLEQLRARDAFEALREVLPALREASERGMLYFAKAPEPLQSGQKEYAYRHEPVDLLRAMARIYARGIRPAPPDMGESVPARIVYSVRDKSFQILSALKKSSLTLRSLYRACASRSEVVATFLSVLELCSMGSVEIGREGEEYRLRFVGGDVDEILDRIIE
ncbi:MAG: segregation/condensation protein A [Oscillospiraceae bacterium]|nr:segregation/condensation protein A [Oscillospiraceae bacterium]